MENESNRLKYFSLLLALFLGVFSYSSVFAYSAETTHPALTSEIVKFYNHFYPNTFSDAEKQIIMRGSKAEDHPFYRPINHFYDPVTEKGLFQRSVSAKKWIVSTKTQAIESGNLIAGVSESLYSAGGDYSWERGIYEYVYGDKTRALETLGHVLHLVEDMTVPPHVRDDQHLVGIDTSPYEKWTSRYAPENITTVERLLADGETPVYRGSIEGYMHAMAAFTNAHFFSKDTLPFPSAGASSIHWNKYPVPEYAIVGSGELVDGEKQSFGISETGGFPYKLFELRERGSIGSREIKKRYQVSIDGENEPILEDYWQILSREAVMNGAGVVKLFFDEVEKEKQTHALQKKNTSFLAKVVPGVKSLASSIAASVGNQGGVDSTLAEQNLASVDTALESSTKTIFELELPPVPDDVLVKIANAQVESADADDDASGQSVDAALDQEQDTKDETLETKEVKSGGEDIHNNPNRDVVKKPRYEKVYGNEEPDNERPNRVEEDNSSFTITSPDNESQNATTTVTFLGTGSMGTVISQDFSSATTTVGTDGAWELTLSGLTQGTTTVMFSTSDTGAEAVDTENISVFVDSIAPTIESFSVSECEYSLRSDACLLGGAEVTLSWSATDADSYKVFVNGAEDAQATTTSSSSTLEGGTHSLELVAYDTLGNTSTSTAQNIEVFDMPIVINEVAWAGTAAHTSDEWIELYNRTGYTLDLSHVVLYAEDLTPYIELSDSIVAHGYYLIERSASSTTSVAEDLATPFSGVGNSSGLSNSGEVLVLAQSFGGTATSTLDQTPTLTSCGGSWCGGHSSTKTSMERISPSSIGNSAANWGSNNTYTKNGTDASMGVILGTPKSQNSINLLTVGYFCPSETSTYTSGASYTPSSGTCTYISDELSGNRYGDLYRGTLANATLVNGHSLGTSATSVQNYDTVSNPVDGEDMFTAIYEIHDIINDVGAFRSFFKTGANSPPHLRYGMLAWKYSVPVVETAATATTTATSTDVTTGSSTTSSGTDSSTSTSTGATTGTTTDTSTSTTTSSGSTDTSTSTSSGSTTSTTTPPSTPPGGGGFSAT